MQAVVPALDFVEGHAVEHDAHLSRNIKGVPQLQIRVLPFTGIESPYLVDEAFLVKYHTLEVDILPELLQDEFLKRRDTRFKQTSKLRLQDIDSVEADFVFRDDRSELVLESTLLLEVLHFQLTE